MSKFYFRRVRGESRLQFKKLKRQLNRRKGIKYPARPKTHDETREILQDPKISSEFGQTADKYDKFYIDSVVKEEHAFHLFASTSVVDLITKNMVDQPRHYLIDGTFKVMPRTFAQLLVISIEYKNDVCIFYIFLIVRFRDSIVREALCEKKLLNAP